MSLDTDIVRNAVGVLPEEYAGRLIPLKPDVKAPKDRVWQARGYTRQELRYWADRGMGLGLKLGGGLAVVDVDSTDERQKLRDEGVDSEMVTVSAHGWHLFHRTDLPEERQKTQIRWRGRKVDMLLGSNRYVVFPPTRVGEWRYVFEKGLRPIDSLPLLPGSLLIREEVKRTRARIAPLVVPDERQMSYLKKLPPAVEGSGGSRVAFVTALKLLTLTRDDEARAWELFCIWNAGNEPPFDEELEDGPDSLLRKFREALKVRNQKRGA